jgi:hypothetical protein
MVTLVKLERVISGLPHVTQGVTASVSVSSPRRTFGKIEVDHWWEFRVEEGTLALASGGHFQTPATGDAAFATMIWTAIPEEATELNDYRDSLRMVPSVCSFPEGVETIDLSDIAYAIEISDDQLLVSGDAPEEQPGANNEDVQQTSAYAASDDEAALQFGLFTAPGGSLAIAQPDGNSRAESPRALLDKLFTDSRLYKQSQDYKNLLDFVAMLPNFAPFNAMLLQVQKPGLKFAASAHDWAERFGRAPKPKARPLLILWPFAPVALVYDELDTEGRSLPRDVRSFYAEGPIGSKRIERFCSLMASRRVYSIMVDEGDSRAGSIQVVRRPATPKEHPTYRMFINKNHEPPVQFVTIAHELAHLFLGHLGMDLKLQIPDRHGMTHRQVELEAESVAYLVSARNAVKSSSETYLTNFVEQNTTIDDLDVYQVMRAAGQIETMLKLGQRSKFQEGKARR